MRRSRGVGWMWLIGSGSLGGVHAAAAQEQEQESD